jgi:Putative intracellular protease/amidase
MDKRYLISLALIAIFLIAETSVVCSDDVSDKKRVVYVVFDQMIYFTVDIPREIMEKEGIEVTFAAASKEPVEGMASPTGIFLGKPWGMRYKRYTPQLTFNEINPEDYDAIVIAGGPGPKVIKLSEDEELLDLIKEFDEEGKVVAAYALSPLILLKAGVLDGKRYTICKGCLPMYPEVEEALKLEKGAILDEDNLPKMIVSGNAITGWGPPAIGDFSYAIVREVKRESIKVEV